MRRNLSNLVDTEYDVLVVGGGIYGACTAWDAALRGLKVALIEKGDFGQFTSANSMRVIHGGLRYLQDANLLLARQMIVERSTWLRIAPHLVRPLRFVIPTYSSLVKSKQVLAIGLLINDLMAFDRNMGLNSENNLPGGHIISKDEALKEIPGLDPRWTNGGAAWYDAQIHNSERLILEIIQAACAAGAEAANYVQAIGFLRSPDGVSGVRAHDNIIGSEFDIRARVVINSTGAWSNEFLRLLDDKLPLPTIHLSLAFNLVIDQLHADHAIGFPGRSKSLEAQSDNRRAGQMLFIVPWRKYSILGTKHLQFDGSVPEAHLPEDQITDFMAEFNRSYAGIDIKRENIRFIHNGFLPSISESEKTGDVKLLRQSRIHDHAKEGIEGLITVVGVKYTTARLSAQKAVDLVFKKFGFIPPSCKTNRTPIPGGEFHSFDQLLREAYVEAPAALTPGRIERLVRTYGSNYYRYFKMIHSSPEQAEAITQRSPLTKAEVIYSVRHEMAQSIGDIVERRTELWMDADLQQETIRTVAEILAVELGWEKVDLQNALASARVDSAKEHFKNKESWHAI